MAETSTVPDYCSALARSRLLPGERVTMLYNVWLGRAAGSDADVDGFRQFLVSGRHLTDYQSTRVLHGQTEGFLLGGYVILDRVSHGPFAGAFKAVHAATGQVVCLRKLPPERVRDAKAYGRFQRNGRLLSQLDHPNLPRVFHLGSTPAGHYLVMESLDGETLADLFARRTEFAPEDAVRVIVQALEGLQHLCAKRLMHRSVCPASLLITSGAGHVKLLDIGLNREFFDENYAEETHVVAAEYQSPEMARDSRTADIRADIYSLGCVLFHLLAGRPPFEEQDAEAAIVRHATEPPPSILTLVPEAAPGLAAVLKVMLAKKPTDRFGVPQEAAEALAAFLPLENAAPPAARINPAYLQWLASENREPVASIGGPMSSTRLPGLRLSGPVSSSRIQRAPMGGPVSSSRLTSGPVSSSRLSTGLGATGQVPSRIAPTLKPPTAPPRPATNLIAPVNTTPPTESDVELMPLEELQARIVYSQPVRPLYVLDRRDMIMLGIGSGGVAAAVVIGILVAKFNSDKIRRGPEE